jgi:hypothetical protein
MVALRKDEENIGVLALFSEWKNLFNKQNYHKCVTGGTQALCQR